MPAPTKSDTETTPSRAVVVSDACSASSDLRAKLDALSLRAKEWLGNTCARFAEDEGYDKWPEEIAECVAAGLIRKRNFYIDINEDVMGLVYSDSYFQQNDQARDRIRKN